MKLMGEEGVELSTPRLGAVPCVQSEKGLTEPRPAPQWLLYPLPSNSCFLNAARWDEPDRGERSAVLARFKMVLQYSSATRLRSSVDQRHPWAIAPC